MVDNSCFGPFFLQWDIFLQIDWHRRKSRLIEKRKEERCPKF